MEECPDPSNDANFKEWMQFQKQNWRRIRQNFKAKKQVVATSAQSLVNGNQFMSNFMKNMDNVILASTWNIVQIEETPAPGIMKLWVTTADGAMFDIKLRIPRVIYINSKVQSDDKTFKKVTNKILPRNRQTYHLYEWQTPEEDFLDRFNSITYNYLLNSNIEGIYETKMPLKFRAIYELGCLVRPRKSSVPVGESARGRVYNVNELEATNSMQSQAPYLQSGTFRQIKLFHRVSGARHVFALFVEDQAQCHVFTVDPSRKKYEENTEILLFKNTFTQLLQEAELDVELAEWDIVHQHVFNELTAALRHIDKQVKEKFRDQIKPATLCILQSDLAPERLQFMGLMMLMSEFPVIRYPLTPEDRGHSSLTWL